jgi:hypothetical protein
MAGAPSIFAPSNTPRTAWPRIWPRWILGLMAVGIAGAIFYWAEQNRALGLNVHATDSTSQVRIAWDKTSKTVRNARAGYVEITDGDQNLRVDLDANELHLGYVNYQRLLGLGTGGNGWLRARSAGSQSTANGRAEAAQAQE